LVLTIKTTGLENYLPGGEANIKQMVVGGPGAGKTRYSSFWPKPIYADCEAGLASVADRNVPYVPIKTSEDMLQFLKYLANECKRPPSERKFHTAIIDTLDSFQRKVKDEWLQANPSYASFSGYDAWGYLDAKMQMLMTRLLNLDMNVIVLVHYKDKVVTEGKGEGKTETHQLMLQLQGDIKDSAFNDFDLVGWMDTYWKPGEDGKRIQARGLTFKATPDRPFLKDRLHVTPDWLEITFSEDDYTNLFKRFMERVDSLKEGGVVGTIDEQPDDNAIQGEGVVTSLAGGPLPPVDPKDMPLSQLKKDELIQMARGIPAIADEVKTNLLKGEIIALIERGRELERERPNQQKATSDGEATAGKADEPAEEVKQVAQQPEKPAKAPDEPASSPASDSTPVQGGEIGQSPSGEPVDTKTGELLTPEQVAERLGATVISDESDVDTDTTGAQDEPQDTGPPAVMESKPPAEKPAEAKTEEQPKVCAECGKDLSGENPDYVKLGWIKFRKLLCNEHYVAAKNASK
jgi:hypothetical protein